jgi:hypothetical protein
MHETGGRQGGGVLLNAHAIDTPGGRSNGRLGPNVPVMF